MEARDTERANLRRIVLALESSGADSSGLTAGVPQIYNGNGGSDTRNGMWLCWRREIPPFAKAAKDGTPRDGEFEKKRDHG